MWTRNLTKSASRIYGSFYDKLHSKKNASVRLRTQSLFQMYYNCFFESPVLFITIWRPFNLEPKNVAASSREEGEIDKTQFQSRLKF